MMRTSSAKDILPPPGKPPSVVALKVKLARCGRLLAGQGLVVAADGNLSARVPDGSILITRTRARLDDLHARDFVRCTPAGATLSRGQPSSELKMHLAIYRRRPDVGAVLHAHPPWAVALSLAGLRLDAEALPELLMTLGEVPTAPFTVPGTTHTAKVVADLLHTHRAVILERHGAVAVGADIEQALQNLERLEFAARVTAWAHLLGGVRPLPARQAQALMKALTSLSPTPSSK